MARQRSTALGLVGGARDGAGAPPRLRLLRAAVGLRPGLVLHEFDEQHVTVRDQLAKNLLVRRQERSGLRCEISSAHLVFDQRVARVTRSNVNIGAPRATARSEERGRANGAPSELKPGGGVPSRSGSSLARLTLVVPPIERQLARHGSKR